MTFDAAFHGLSHLAKVHGLDAGYSPFPKSSARRRTIESIAHELAHALCFGQVMSTSTFEKKIRQMPNALADQHELTALRVEVAALRQLGVPVDGRRLCKLANFCDVPPPLARMQDPLTVAEQALVGWFVTLVQGAVQEAR